MFSHLHPEENGKIYYRHDMNCPSEKYFNNRVFYNDWKDGEIKMGLTTFLYNEFN